MNKEDEIKQINEIINKLDIIQEDEWQQQEGETAEEYNDRIESVEEEIEEELLDYISDSLLIEQEINEDEAIKEAQEKIKNDYRLFSDAFVKNEDGTISLKNEEGLAELGYDAPEEIEKLKEIEANMNNPEQYLNKIRESIKASKDIDTEIDRKMELAKSIISAKKRGETIPSGLNPNLEKDKFEKVNEFISNTSTLKKVPTIQREYVTNNYVAERRYNNLINNTIPKTNPINRSTTTATTTQPLTQTIPNTSKTVQKVVTKKIPERKNIVYTNFEKKLDKDNDLTKQKIKARTELKILFKEIEDKELTKEELEELNLKIENIKKKYPNTVTEKNIDKLYTTFKVKLPTEKVEQQIENVDNTNKDDENKLDKIQQKVEEELEEIKDGTIAENKEEKVVSTDVQQQATEIIDEIADAKKKKIKTEPNIEVKVEPATSKTRKKSTDVALGTLIGGVIGATIGTLKRKSDEKIDDLKQKGEEVIGSIKKQKQKRKKETTKPKKEEKEVVEKVEILDNPPEKEVANNKTNNSKNEEVIQSKEALKKSSMSKKELMESLKKAESLSVEFRHEKGIDLLIINKLISYLKDNDDPEIQERLNKEIVELQTDKNKNSGKLFIYTAEQTYPKTLNYLYECYKDGVKSTDGKRDIIPTNNNAASYYLYITHNIIQVFNKLKISEQQQLEKNLKELETRKSYVESLKNTNEKEKQLEIIKSYTDTVEKNKRYLERYNNIEKTWNLPHDFTKRISENFSENVEETCYGYFEFLNEKYKIDTLEGVDRLLAESCFMNELKSAKNFNENSEYLNLAISKEFVSRIADDSKKFIDKIQTIEKEKNKKTKINPRILKLLGNIFYNGIKSASNQEIIKQDKRKAKEIYEQIIKENEQISDSEILNNLINMYSDKTEPFYNKEKAEELIETAYKKGIFVKEKDKKQSKEEQTIYVCSDLHGEYPTYKSIINQLNEKDKLYVLGDVIDRGPDGIKILRDMKKRKEKGQIELVIGNHEFSMIRALFFNHKESLKTWEKDGEMTKKDFERLEPKEQDEIRKFLLDSYVYKNIRVNSKNIHLVHAKAIQDKDDNNDKTVSQMMAEGKEKKILEAVQEYPSAKANTLTIVGHRPTFNVIEYKNGLLDIDCGASYGHNAALVNLSTGVVKYIDAKYEREKDNNKQKGK